MHPLDGGEALLPVVEALGAVFDVVQQGVFADMGKHQAAGRFGQKARGADIVRGQRPQARGFGGDGFAAAGIGHGLQGTQAQVAGNKTEQAVAPLRYGFAGLAHPHDLAVGQVVACDGVGLAGQNAGEFGGIIGHQRASLRR